ncbi:type I restriction-modification system specificity subunit [Bacteroidia bacterium]|nr:type I restriction-modification system specificity subunit [Bacteroidia bacterium]
MNIDKSKWTKVKFGDVAIQQKESVDIETTHLNRYIAGEHMDTEDIHLRKWGIVGDGYLGPAFIRKFEKGDVLYGSRRTYLKKVAVADFDGITANTTFVIKANEKIINPKLLPFLMLSDGFTKHSIENSKGSVNPYINWKDIANYEFLLPPKEEQARLAELLWVVDDVGEREKEVKERLSELRLLIIENHLNSSENNMRLGDCLIVKKKKSKAPHSIEKYIGLEHIESGVFFTDNFDNASSVLADSYIFNKGDLLYSKLRPYLDKAIIASFDGICTTELIIYDVNAKSSKEYILNVLHSKKFLDYIVDKSFGTKMPRVSQELVSDFSFYLPTIEEQDDILNELKMITNSINVVSHQLNHCITLKLVLINKIF